MRACCGPTPVQEARGPRIQLTFDLPTQMSGLYWGALCLSHGGHIALGSVDSGHSGQTLADGGKGFTWVSRDSR